MHILLTNDDGYFAPGIQYLYDELSKRHHVVVVAPQTEQSGIGHAFTHKAALRCKRMTEGIGGYSVCGTPSDCVKLAIAKLLPRPPNMVVSGINAGENTGMAGFYSGTLAAAREAAFWRVSAAAFSVCEGAEAHMAAYAAVAARIVDKIAKLQENGFPNKDRRTYFNVNFPACAPAKLRGVKVTRQSLAFFDDRYRQVGANDDGVDYKLRGDRKDLEASDEYDSRAVESGYIAITPLGYDATAEEALEASANWKQALT